jgi:hypothetical protein
MEEIERRLDRIESQISRLVSSIESLARLDERQLGINRDMAELKERTADFEIRLRAFEEYKARASIKMDLGERLWWTLAATVLSIFAAVGWFR